MQPPLMSPQELQDKVASLTKGMTITCQFGNRTDTSGFRVGAVVTILEVQDAEHCYGGKAYLVDDGNGLLGRATIPLKRKCNRDMNDDLYCTMAMRRNDLADLTNVYKTLRFELPVAA